MCDRKEVVSVLGEHPSPYAMTSRVSQDYILWPLLFIAYVNDVDASIHHLTLLKYANNMNLYIDLLRSCAQQKHSFLQDDLNSLQRWLDQWQLRLAAEKYKVVHL